MSSVKNIRRVVPVYCILVEKGIPPSWIVMIPNKKLGSYDQQIINQPSWISTINMFDSKYIYIYILIVRFQLIKTPFSSGLPPQNSSSTDRHGICHRTAPWRGTSPKHPCVRCFERPEEWPVKPQVPQGPSQKPWLRCLFKGEMIWLGKNDLKKLWHIYGSRSYRWQHMLKYHMKLWKIRIMSNMG